MVTLTLYCYTACGVEVGLRVLVVELLEVDVLHVLFKDVLADACR